MVTAMKKADGGLKIKSTAESRFIDYTQKY